MEVIWTYSYLIEIAPASTPSRSIRVPWAIISTPAARAPRAGAPRRPGRDRRRGGNGRSRCAAPRRASPPGAPPATIAASSPRWRAPRAVTQSGNSAQSPSRRRWTFFTSTQASGSPAPVSRKSTRLAGAVAHLGPDAGVAGERRDRRRRPAPRRPGGSAGWCRCRRMPAAELHQPPGVGRACAAGRRRLQPDGACPARSGRASRRGWRSAP